MGITLRLTGTQHKELRSHLISGDGKESIALIFCKPVYHLNGTILLAKKLTLIPDTDCSSRTPVEVTWPTEKYLLPHIQQIEQEELSVIAIHSHPNGYPTFSFTDDQADIKILGSLYNCIDGLAPHGSAIMYPGGSIKARTMNRDGSFAYISRVSVAGDSLTFYDEDDTNRSLTEYQKKTEQVFGKGTLRIIKSLRIGVVGCSGTGSPVIELLMRHSVGSLVLVDFDTVKNSNLNRMIMARVEDAKNSKSKIELYQEWGINSGLETHIHGIKKPVEDDEAIVALSNCDVIFGCVDNVEARHFINKLCTAYLIPLLDLGVGITLDKNQIGGISHAISRCHYVQPDRAGLLDRGAFTAESLAAEDYKRTDPKYYQEQINAGYLSSIEEDQPAVMCLTMDAAVMGVQDLLARLHGFRIDDNRNFEMQERNITHGYYKNAPQADKCVALKRFFAVGDNIRESLR